MGDEDKTCDPPAPGPFDLPALSAKALLIFPAEGKGKLVLFDRSGDTEAERASDGLC